MKPMNPYFVVFDISDAEVVHSIKSNPMFDLPSLKSDLMLHTFMKWAQFTWIPTHKTDE